MHAQTRTALIFVAALALGACTVYRPETRQGNFIEDAKVAQVKPGMTREQVRFLLGPPMIADGFHLSQWDYFYQYESQQMSGGMRRHFVVYFEGDAVTSIDYVGQAVEQHVARPGDTTVPKPSSVVFEEPAAAPVAKPADAPVEKPADATPTPPPAETPAPPPPAAQG